MARGCISPPPPEGAGGRPDGRVAVSRLTFHDWHFNITFAAFLTVKLSLNNIDAPVDTPCFISRYTLLYFLLPLLLSGPNWQKTMRQYLLQ